MQTISISALSDQAGAATPLFARAGPIAFAALRSIAVFRALGPGELLCVVPALRALRRAAPSAVISLIGLPSAEPFLARFPHYLDDHVAFPGFPGLSDSVPQIGLLPRFLNTVQRRAYDLVLQWHGSGSLSNAITGALGARRQAGYFLPGEYCPDPLSFAPWVEREQETMRYLRLCRWLGAEAADGAMEFPVHAEDEQRLSLALSAAGTPLSPGAYVCIDAGARLASRRWPAARFAELAEALLAQGWQVVWMGADGATVDWPHAARDQGRARPGPPGLARPGLARPGPAPLVLPALDLGATAALLRGARALVCNDGDASQLAAALGTPSVVVCCGADPQRWAPLDRQRHRMVYAAVPCRPCGYAACPIGHPCALHVGVAQVLAETARLLGRRGA
ncbi:MAG: glycosyltransferase family 9 protein [Pseudomonadota bacterium]